MAERCLLYYITDRTAFAADEPNRRRRLLEKIAEAARAGVDYIQLREKDLSGREMESLAREAVGVVRQVRSENPEQRTMLVINSRTDVALATGADGVHLRSDDVSPEVVRKMWREASYRVHHDSREGLIIGVSCHAPEDVVRAEEQGASFAVFAPIFEKKDAPRTRPAGLDLLKQASQAKIPVLALGGITLSNAPSCLKAGASGIAAIRLFQENNVAAVIRELRSQ